MGSVTVWSNVRFDWVGLKILRVIRLAAAMTPYDYCITSAMDGNHGSSSYHYGNLSYGGSEAAADDIGCFNSKPDRSARARALASILYRHSDLCVELIVSGVGSGLNWAGGYYVKNGHKVAPYAVADHYNHIHYAQSAAQADRMIARLEAATPYMFKDLAIR